ncbi:hypothetical protein Clacol_000550 [Clathrus columnatus]|uniref:Nuclear pore complex NUP2/50/61 domain-containing protein n=1 Tax=Clathrus columnatus TaxID=1419009 RepID=A0AAV4ZWS3_9AGAM|nr:hypothetical protein Clacol_000550 [Clathrus columnatus]
MKRTAENQLTKDTIEDEDDIEEGKSGFQKADADSLATRKSTILTIAYVKTSIGSSRFVGFSGFGSNKDDIKVWGLTITN